MIMKYQVTIHGPANLPPGTYEAEVEVEASPDHGIRLVVSEPRPQRANIGMVIKVEAKDEFDPAETGHMMPGGLPSVNDLARLTQDVMADTTKHDRTVGWRVISVEPVI